MFSRIVGLIVMGIAIIGLLVLWWTISTTESTLTSPSDGVVFVGGVPFTYSW